MLARLIVAKVQARGSPSGPGRRRGSPRDIAFFAGGDWVCSIASYTGTMKGPMIGPDGTESPPTGKSFDVDFCTVGHWKNGQMVEEYLFYDAVTFMKQIGLSK